MKLFVMMMVCVLGLNACAANPSKAPKKKWSLRESWMRNADKWEKTRAGSLPASRQGVVKPYSYSSLQLWGMTAVRESREYVFVEEVWLPGGNEVHRRFVKVPFKYEGKWVYDHIIYYNAPITTDPKGWTVAGTIYWPDPNKR